MDQPPAFFVSYVNGSCGTFIAAIIERMVCPLVRRPITGNYWNNAHGSIQTNTDSALYMNRFKDAGDYFQKLPVRDPRQPIFHPSHFYDPKSILERWPQAKIILVSHTIEDAREIAINSLFKFALNDVVGFNNGHFQKRIKEFFCEKECPLTGSAFEFDIFGPNEVNLAIELRKYSGLQQGYWSIKVLEHYKDKVLEVPYAKIVNDKRWTVDTLSTFLGYKSNSFVEYEYDNYLYRQNTFMNSVQEFLNQGKNR